ncbi:hypothetical protein EK21DRAFT_101096 [Setomelanomma holmii]|uniref:Fork-head domain-containing protein n=1 Tax=Setomelanomma holmii TaxID=210430 RepID=A0A9P4LLR5_9PLEO|nr:hypothetical protein EK21DRAFT_101096 [Setomelanomma holmii]
MSLDEPESMQWAAPNAFSVSQNRADYQVHDPITSSSEGFYPYVQNGMTYDDNFNLAYTPQYPTSSCPRSFAGLDLTGLPREVSMSDAYPPAAYQIDPAKHHDVSSLSDPGANDDYEHHYGAHIKYEDNSDYRSPYSDLTRASTPNDDPQKYSHDLGSGDFSVIDKEQPYAQLIYKALLEADNHTMILRDIYDWFRKYTDKASASETKGWQNSIRHNLSMNGAFEKVDQPCEESRKGFMWRLTEEALREGVKSTTRYRSKQPNKRGHRNHQPQPQRQASGAKGGQAARRSANLRRSRRMYEHCRNEPYISRSVPAAFDPSYHPDTVMPYPPSPYYESDDDFAYNTKHNHGLDFGSPMMNNGLDLFASSRPYNGPPMMHGLPMGESAYVLDQNPSEPLFTNSPSPTADEPRTPEAQGGWDEHLSLDAPGVLDDTVYQEYAG